MRRGAPAERLGRDEAGLLQSCVGAVFVQRLHRSCRHFDPDMLAQFRNPNAVLLEIRSEGAGHVFGDVATNAALFLGHTAPVNDAAAGNLRTCDIANF